MLSSIDCTDFLLALAGDMAVEQHFLIMAVFDNSNSLREVVASGVDGGPCQKGLQVHGARHG